MFTNHVNKYLLKGFVSIMSALEGEPVEHLSFINFYGNSSVII